MRGEECGLHVDTVRRAQPTRDAQHLELVGEIESVARLDLHRRDTLGEETSKTRLAGAQQFGLGRRARRLHGRDDPAAGTSDVLIARALQALFEFVGAIAGVDQVRVAVDEARRQPAAFAVELRGGANGARQRGARAQPGDPPVAYRKRAVAHRAVRRPGSHRRQCDVDDDKIAIDHGLGCDHASRRFMVCR